jgi:hypothetical protein
MKNDKKKTKKNSDGNHKPLKKIFEKIVVSPEPGKNEQLIQEIKNDSNHVSYKKMSQIPHKFKLDEERFNKILRIKNLNEISKNSIKLDLIGKLQRETDHVNSVKTV